MSRRTLLWMGVAAVVALGVVWMLRPEALAVSTAVVDRGPLEVVVEEDGETRVEDRYVLSAPVTGRLVRLQCEAGDSVTKGEVLARVYPLPLDSRAVQDASGRLGSAEALHRSARARLDQAETVRDEARRTLARLEAVSAQVPGSVSEQRLDDARATERSAALEVEQARGGVESAAFQVQSARAALLGAEAGTEGEPVPVLAPADGRVLRLYEECERAITAGSPILEVGDPRRLKVVAELLSEDAARIRDGAEARITWGEGRDTVPGWVRTIEPSAFTQVSPLGVEEQRVNVIVAFDGGEVLLGDRYAVDVTVLVWSADDVLRVPVSALFRVDGGWGVFVLEDGRARQRRIELGQRGRLQAQVLNGLAQGETVILYPSSEMEDGVRVESDGS
ncbi:MAG TPA: efflux RND transporter periplasmic adaptor subunit [Longimicrobiales bacterium]|nr:efflux RND transporter periplasmic adaptor subunit [Longimicrobiales bacterium]